MVKKFFVHFKQMLKNFNLFQIEKKSKNSTIKKIKKLKILKFSFHLL